MLRTIGLPELVISCGLFIVFGVPVAAAIVVAISLAHEPEPAGALLEPHGHGRRVCAELPRARDQHAPSLVDAVYVDRGVGNREDAAAARALWPPSLVGSVARLGVVMHDEQHAPRLANQPSLEQGQGLQLARPLGRPCP